MGATGFYRGAGGAVIKLDTPTDVHALERFEQQLEKGELVPLADDQVEEYVAATDIVGGVEVTTIAYREVGLPDPVPAEPTEPQVRAGRKPRGRGKVAAEPAPEPEVDEAEDAPEVDEAEDAPEVDEAE